MAVVEVAELGTVKTVEGGSFGESPWGGAGAAKSCCEIADRVGCRRRTYSSGSLESCRSRRLNTVPGRFCAAWSDGGKSCAVLVVWRGAACH